MRNLSFIILFIVLSVSVLYAGNSSRIIKAVRTAVPPSIDGMLTDDCWKQADPVSDFTQRDPHEGEPASEKTEIRVLYDDNALYFSCMFYDSEPAKIISRLTRRDNEIESDNGSIRIDSYHDHQTAFEFTFNPAGVKIDILQFDDANHEDVSWDAVWDVETKILSDGWSAEVKIPFHILRYKTTEDANEMQAWGINFLRYISRKQESDWWAFVPKSENGFISRFGHLQGLQNLPVPNHVELLPFIVGQQSYKPAESFRQKQDQFLGNLGFDLRYGLSSNFTLDLTVNPDFGQVEADPAVLNLTTIETFYPEKRPFFIEGTQIIHFSTFGGDFGPGMFYSRRVGRALTPQDVNLSGGKIIKEMPSSVTILGAAKVTGKTSSGLSVGILQAFTEEENAILLDSANHESEQMVEPFAHYSVLRLKQDVLQNSNVGWILTSVEKNGRYPALTTGFDWNLKFENSTYQLDGFLSLTHTTNQSMERVTGSAGRVTYAKISGEHWTWSIDGDFTAKKFNINDIGFFRRPNDWGSVATLNYHERVPAEVLRNYTIGLFLHERNNFDGVNLYREVNLGSDFLFTNYWNLSGSLGSDFGLYDDRETRGNGLYRRPDRFTSSLELSTDSRNDIVFGIEQGFNWDSKKATVLGTELAVLIKPLSWMEYEVEAAFNKARNQEAWVDNVSGNSIFGDRSTDDVSFTLRSAMTFTRDLTLQVYGQLFLAKGHYENFRRLIGTSDFTGDSYAGDPDFNSRMVHSNVVLRWEYHPGSTLYLVWSHSREAEIPDYFRSFGNDVDETFRIPPANVLLLKASYYLGL